MFVFVQCLYSTMFIIVHIQKVKIVDDIISLKINCVNKSLSFMHK